MKRSWCFFSPSQYVCRHVCVVCYRCEVNNHNIQTKRKRVAMCFHWSLFILYLPGALAVPQLETLKASRKSIKVPQNKMCHGVFMLPNKSFHFLLHLYVQGGCTDEGSTVHLKRLERSLSRSSFANYFKREVGKSSSIVC